MECLWREVVLCQLLIIVEILFLEGFLIEQKFGKKSIKQSLMLINFVFKYYNSVCMNSVFDFFMRIVFNCIECLFKGLLVLEKDFVREQNLVVKIQVFYVFSGYYKLRSDFLLLENFIEVYLVILNFIIQQKYEVVIVLLQLDMIILFWYIREEFRRLFKFMVVCFEMIDFFVDLKVNFFCRNFFIGQKLFNFLMQKDFSLIIF